MEEDRGGVDLSVVIPCRNVEVVLGAQLEALAAEEAPASWEVVVVDNASTDATAEVALAFRERLPSLRVVSEPRPGRHYACNAGAAASTGRWIAFVDADDVVQAGWVASMARALERHEVVAGRLVHETSGYGTVQTKGLMNSLGFLPHASGCNLGIRREVFDEAGGFRPDVPYAEDVDLSWRLQLAGHEIAFAPEAALSYHQRSRLGEMFRQHRRFGAAQARLWALYRHLGMPRRTLSEAARDWARVIAAIPRLRDPGVRARSLRRLARNVGRLQGSVRSRVFYP